MNSISGEAASRIVVFDTCFSGVSDTLLGAANLHTDSNGPLQGWLLIESHVQLQML